MTAKKWDGASFTDILTTKKRWDGSSWVDLTVAKRWDGTAWQDIPGVIGSGLSISTSAATVYGDVFSPEPAPATALVTSTTVTTTVTGGTGPYTYAWTRVSGSSSVSANSPTASSTSFSAIVGKNQVKTAFYKVVVTDSLAATAEAFVSVELSYTTDI